VLAPESLGSLTYARRVRLLPFSLLLLCTACGANDLGPGTLSAPGLQGPRSFQVDAFDLREDEHGCATRSSWWAASRVRTGCAEAAPRHIPFWPFLLVTLF
jgi:hypothetical protein